MNSHTDTVSILKALYPEGIKASDYESAAQELSVLERLQKSGFKIAKNGVHREPRPLAEPLAMPRADETKRYWAPARDMKFPEVELDRLAASLASGRWVSIRKLANRVHRHYATVQVMLDRLREKGVKIEEQRNNRRIRYRIANRRMGQIMREKHPSNYATANGVPQSKVDELVALLKTGPCTFGDLKRHFEKASSTVSGYIKAARVRGHRINRIVNYKGPGEKGQSRHSYELA